MVLTSFLIFTNIRTIHTFVYKLKVSIVPVTEKYILTLFSFSQSAILGARLMHVVNISHRLKIVFLSFSLSYWYISSKALKPTCTLKWELIRILTTFHIYKKKKKNNQSRISAHTRFLFVSSKTVYDDRVHRIHFREISFH